MTIYAADHIRHTYIRHDCIGHNYIGHNYVGHNCTGYKYVHNDCIGNGYVSPDCMRINHKCRNYVGRIHHQRGGLMSRYVLLYRMHVAAQLSADVDGTYMS